MRIKSSFILGTIHHYPGPPTGGGGLGHFSPGPSVKGAPGGPMKGPLNTCLKDRYTLIEQSDLNTLIEQSQYSSEEQCSKLIDKEIWLVMASYCHCQQVVTFSFFFFFWSSPYNLGQGPHFNSLPWAPYFLWAALSLSTQMISM